MKGAIMKGEKTTLVFLLSLLGSILILINCFLVVLNRMPVIISSGSANPQNVLAENAPFWWRISFGFRGFVEGQMMILWVIFAVIVLFSSLMFYVTPLRRKMLGSLIIIFSILSIPTGGGFIMGLILAIIGGGMMYEWPKPWRETFFGRFIRAARLDSNVYSSVAEDAKALKQAVFTIILVNFLSGLGMALYSFNVGKIVIPASSISISTRIILFGEMFWDNQVFLTPLTFAGLAVIKWLILSGVMYLIGVKVTGATTEFEKIGKVIGFAYAPVSLQFFLPFLFTSKPNLMATWPMILFFITNIWMILTLVVGLKQCLDVPLGKSLGITFLGGTAYWLINQLIFVKALGTSIQSSAIAIFPLPQIPGVIQLAIEPTSLILLFMSIIVMFSVLLGVFSKR